MARHFAQCGPVREVPFEKISSLVQLLHKLTSETSPSVFVLFTFCKRTYGIDFFFHIPAEIVTPERPALLRTKAFRFLEGLLQLLTEFYTKFQVENLLVLQDTVRVPVKRVFNYSCSQCDMFSDPGCVCVFTCRLWM